MRKTCPALPLNPHRHTQILAIGCKGATSCPSRLHSVPIPWMPHIETLWPWKAVCHSAHASASLKSAFKGAGSLFSSETLRSFGSPLCGWLGIVSCTSSNLVSLRRCFSASSPIASHTFTICKPPPPPPPPACVVQVAARQPTSR